jgi:hypothetical protein
LFSARRHAKETAGNKKKAGVLHRDLGDVTIVWLQQSESHHPCHGPNCKSFLEKQREEKTIGHHLLIRTKKKFK